MRQGRPSHSGWPVPRRLRRWIESARLTQCSPCRSAQPQTNNFIETGQERRARTCPAPTLALSPRPAPARACSTRSRRAAATGSIDRISAPVEPREHRPAHSGRPHPPPRPRSTDQGQRRRPGRRRARRRPTAPERRSHDYVRARTPRSSPLWTPRPARSSAHCTAGTARWSSRSSWPNSTVKYRPAMRSI